MSDEPTHESPDPDEGRTAEYPTMIYPPAGSTTAVGEATEPLGFDPDPEADAEWVVQTTRGVRLGYPVAGLLVVLLVAAGFWGGAAVEKSHAGSSGAGSLASLASRFRGARAGGTGTTTTGASGFAGFGGGGFGTSAAATGTISVVAGKTIYVLTATGSLVKVTLTPSTTVTRNADTTPGQLRPGDTVVIEGTTSPNGNVAATSVTATAPGVSSTSGGFGLGSGAGGTATSTTAGG